ncbi:Na+/H+ antiporter subunit E [Microcella humidisoli]|uniref:Na+/H+ antiporter subunit E n=1 Tax=Microcella humidisoli TaxID=2963406 RepID=A0ABY5FV97_9MICO|nr:Na+/H+ antiporter subunit E [Microcella humidisoli]UTT61701.1 Na+/H+ antiporter subunit E [Microcella humidisoli]
MSEPSTTAARARVTVRQQLPLLAALVALWMMLWGSMTPLTILSGIVVALIVTRAFYLPAVELSGRFNPFWFAVFVARVLAEMVVASFQVALLAIGPRARHRSALVKVDLTTRSDFILTGTALAVSLVPGSVVVEVDRASTVLYVHSLSVRTDADVEKARAHVLGLERDLLRAWGSRAEWEAVRP